jgi:hypothetical protein
LILIKISAEQLDRSNNDSRDCVLTNGGICYGWSKTGFKAKKNFVFADENKLHDIFPPVLDSRWHSEQQIFLERHSRAKKLCSGIRGFPAIASDGTFSYLFNIGNKKEHIRFHTSVLCADGVTFVFAKNNKTTDGEGYAVTFHRISLDNATVVACKIGGGNGSFYSCSENSTVTVKFTSFSIFWITKRFFRKCRYQ